MRTRLNTFHRLSLIACAVLTLCASVIAETTAKAAFSQQTAQVGEEIELTIHVSGTAKVKPPDAPRLDGLVISYAGGQRTESISWINGKRSDDTGATLTYTVLPEKAGAFTIPALTVFADGRPIQTEPVALKVEPGKGGPGENASGDPQRFLWLELSVPKTTLYLGETVSAEMRLYTSVQIGLEEMPEITADGFTQTKLPTQPPRGHVQRNGRDYNVFTFETAITPTKAGKLQFGPAKMHVRAAVPRAQPRRQSPFPDPFEDFFGSGPFVQTQTRELTAEPVGILVKPLPADKPADFSGAVGKFTLSAQGSPGRVKIGDPVTMVLKIAGAGNFDRVTAPTLADPQGWRAYPPSSSFKAEDPAGVHGLKKFEVAVIPEEKKTAMPVFQFSYFDPGAEKYVTLSSGKAPLQVDGQSIPAPPPVASTGAPQAPPVAAAAPVPTDIHGISYEVGRPASLDPPWMSRPFWFAQSIPAALLLGLVSFRSIKRRPDAGRIASLRRAHAENLSRMRGLANRVEFYDRAVRALQAESATKTGQPPGAVDASAVCRAHRLGPAVASAVEKIFHARAESVYAGAGGGGEPLSSEERSEVLATIHQVAGSK